MTVMLRWFVSDPDASKAFNDNILLDESAVVKTIPDRRRNQGGKGGLSPLAQLKGGLSSLGHHYLTKKYQGYNTLHEHHGKTFTGKFFIYKRLNSCSLVAHKLATIFIN